MKIVTGVVVLACVAACSTPPDGYVKRLKWVPEQCTVTAPGTPSNAGGRCVPAHYVEVWEPAVIDPDAKIPNQGVRSIPLDN